MLRQRLNLTAKQEKQVADLQKEVDARLAEILTAEQRNQLKTMRDRGPGGFGPPGGPGGRQRGARVGLPAADRPSAADRLRQPPE